MSRRRSPSAVPGPRRGPSRAEPRSGASALPILAYAAVGGLTIGVGSVAINAEQRTAAVAAARPIAVKAGLARPRPPQAGDHWSGCDDARAAGTAPIYSPEPGYRSDMDGDGDGIACEPVP